MWLVPLFNFYYCRFMDKQYKAAEAWAEYWYETRKYKLDLIFEKLEFV